MTLARRPVSIALQWVGLFGSVVGFLLTLALAAFLVPGWVVACAIALILDAVAIRSRSIPMAVGASIGKLAIVLVAMATVTLGRAAIPVDAAVAPDTGPLFLLLSVLPSLLGAALRRDDR